MNTIAQELYQNIEEQGLNPAQHTTKNGLTVTLRYADTHGQRFWTLSLTKHYRQATNEEREKAKEAFNVPRDAQYTPTYRNGWGIVRYTWIEKQAEQLQIVGLGGEVDFNNWQEKFE